MLVDIGYQSKTVRANDSKEAPAKRFGYTLLSGVILSDMVAIADMFVIFACSWISKIIYIDGFNNVGNPQYSYVGVGLVGAILAYFVMKERWHYNLDRNLEGPEKISRIFRSLLVSFVLLVAIAYMLQIAEHYSRGWLLLWFTLSFVSIVLVRKASFALRSYLARQNYLKKRIALIGADSYCRKVKEHLEGKGNLKTQIVGIYSMPDDQMSGGNGKTLLTDLIPKLINTSERQPVDQVIIAMPSIPSKLMRELKLKLGRMSARIDFLPGDGAFAIETPQFSSVGGLGLYNIQNQPISERGQLIKVIGDSVASLALLIILSPFMALISLLVKVTSSGNILFVQKRHGLNGQVIHVMKFRTMYEKSDRQNDGTMERQATKNDSRITPVGRFLRRSSLDELPQLINIIMGDMSLVGPRPHAISHNNHYGEMFEEYANRNRVKPGLTGWAQVNGFRGETEHPDLMKKRIDFDLEYIDNWSIWLDLKILLMTFPALIFSNKAY